MAKWEYPLLKQEDLSGLKERLETRKLTEDDFTLVTQLIDLALLRRKEDSVEGRPVIAHLPFGMDIIK